MVLRAVRTYRRAYLAASNADGPEAEVFDRLNGPTHSNTPRYNNRPSGIHLRVCLKQNHGFETKVSRGRNQQESITTVLRRSSAEEKTAGKRLVK